MIFRPNRNRSNQRGTPPRGAGAPIDASTGKATGIRLFSVAQPHMRTFHMTWTAFFLAFFGWFGIAPMMAIVRDDLGLTKTQVGNTVIASVLATIAARLIVGWLCDRIGPRRAYAGLLIVGSIPVMTIGLANSYETFLLFRLGIGVIGASFVITQYHTSVMFAPNVVGTANATTAGWGNLGGGVTQMAMPLILAVIVGLGASEFLGWRLAMVVPGAALLCMGVAYWRLTQDAPLEQEHKALANAPRASGEAGESAFLAAAKDHRVWALFLIYGACFGIELTMHNIAALYFHDRFGLGIAIAGLVAGLFGLMNLFARTLGGAFGDRAGRLFGLKGRTMFLGGALLLEGIALITFSQMAVLPLAIVSMLVFSLFVQMSEGATYSIVPFVNKRALGAVAGIVGAGGNVGAVGAGFLFRMESLQTEQALLLLGVCVIAVSSAVFLVRFSPKTEEEERLAMDRALGKAGGVLAPQRVIMVPYL